MIFNLMKPIPTKTPTMYLYGHEATADENADVTIGGVGYVGAVLPALPEWDKESYPYAFISYNTAGFYSLRCFDIEPSVAYVGNETIVPYDGESGYYIGATSSTDKWNELGEPSEFGMLASSVADNMVWTNFNLRYKGTETVYFTESEPIPVYE